MRFFWNSVRLLLGFGLQSMLDATQKPIGPIKSQGFLRGQQIQFTQCSQRLEHAGLLQKRMPRSMRELQRLHDEFDFANTADTELDIPMQLVGSNYIAFDAALNVGDLLQQVRRGALGIDKRLMLSQEFVRQFTAASDAPRLDECEALPGLAEAGIIIFHALKRSRQRSGRAFRAQPEIDSKNWSRRMRSRKGLQDLISQPVEELVIRNVRRELAFLGVHKEKINVEAVIELAAAEFSKRENCNLRCRRSVPLPQVGVPMFEYATDANLRDLCKRPRGVFE